MYFYTYIGRVLGSICCSGFIMPYKPLFLAHYNFLKTSFLGVKFSMIV